jgi:hypothetical protein
VTSIELPAAAVEVKSTPQSGFGLAVGLSLPISCVKQLVNGAFYFGKGDGARLLPSFLR